ncbi:TPA: Rha family transcriptional regulator [Klebsiella pneumoniae]|nr:Rha family transcriptional regulator [Klebsiella pneumoniae]HBU8750150.1 Rha family transcriptional regulator [Klebsiella pneumoniae]HBW4998644.1 Rha family transcriptional regulator [Klebsiella pneumoniae]HBW5335219.1 Rha family transcriptional regulator [Klebsiella pneumoniae]HBW5633243.1 Rha family transcriptional regulator [Klebsiella pneumoniae]
MKNNGLNGQGQTQPKVSLVDNSVPTMSSLEMVDYINAERKSKAEAEGQKFPCKRYTKIQHKHILAKTPKVLGEGHSAKFLAQYSDSTGRELPCYHYPKREACLIAMSYSYELQAAIYDYMEELDRQRDGYLAHTINELQHIVTSARQFSDEDSSDAGSRLRRRKDDLVLLEKAEYLVKNLSQLPLNFGGGTCGAK